VIPDKKSAFLKDKSQSMGRNLNTLKSDLAFKLSRLDAVRRIVNPARYLLDLAIVKVLGVDDTSTPGFNQPIRVALVSDGLVPTSEEQLVPFSSHRFELRDRLKLVSMHLLLKDVLRSPKFILRPFDIVVLKLSFRTNPFDALSIVRAIRGAIDAGRIIYFDGDDDLCVQWPQILPYVDLYVKKHLLRDRSQYLNRFIGKSNLTDFVHRRYDYSFAQDPISTETTPVPPEQLPKLNVGYNLAMDRNIFRLYGERQSRATDEARDTDVVFRGSVPKDWIYYLRKDIEPALKRLEKSYRVIFPTRRVSIDEYYREMRTSKICISPFGYGEICWRDFEAILCGCLLVKPDMGHVETNPDIFLPHQTYLPVKWDFSDLEEKCSFYLEHEIERQRIVDQAYHVLDNFYGGGGIIKAFRHLLQSAPH
jgi:hypothetical protein